MEKDPVTRSEMDGAIGAAEGRSVHLIDLVTKHFDARLKDSERVLTWRMVWVGLGSVVGAAALELVRTGQDSTVAQAASYVAGLLG